MNHYSKDSEYALFHSPSIPCIVSCCQVWRRKPGRPPQRRVPQWSRGILGEPPRRRWRQLDPGQWRWQWGHCCPQPGPPRFSGSMGHWWTPEGTGSYWQWWRQCCWHTSGGIHCHMLAVVAGKKNKSAVTAKTTSSDHNKSYFLNCLFISIQALLKLTTNWLNDVESRDSLSQMFPLIWSM